MLVIRVAVIFSYLILQSSGTLFIQDGKGLSSVPRDIVPVSTTRIRLMNNAITNITDVDFNGLLAVTEVDLTNNKIRAVSENAFQNTALEILWLNSNPLGFFPNLNVPNTLKKLMMVSCSIVNPNPAVGLDVPYPGLEKLQLTDNKLYKVPNINSRSTLKELFLNQCSLSSIDPGNFEGFQSLEYLYLGGNLFTVLDDFCFKGLTAVKTIMVDKNLHLRNIGSQAFHGLSNLEKIYIRYGKKLLDFPCAAPYTSHLNTLDLRENMISSVPSYCVSPSLRHLNLDRNKVQDLPQAVGNQLTGLYSMHLAYNKITCISTGTINKLQELLKLYIQGNAIKYFPADNCDDPMPSNETLNIPHMNQIHLETNGMHNFPNISKMTALKSIVSYNNKIVAIPPDTFTYANLDYIHLHNNLLTTAPYLKGGCANLWYLRVSNNLITYLPSDYFSDCLKLIQVDFNYNKLISIPDLVHPAMEVIQFGGNLVTHFPNITGLLKLRSFSLTNNYQIGHLPFDAFNGIELGVLWLSNIGISEAPQVNRSCELLSVLYLQKNKITTLPEGYFDNCTFLRTLELSSNQLKNFPSSSLPNLESLVLEYNQIDNFVNLSAMPKLKLLNMRQNKIETIPADAFQTVTLQKLLIGENQLTEPPNLSGRCDELTDLRIDNNEIAFIPNNYFDGCTSLKYLTLNQNRLTSIPNLQPIGPSLQNLHLGQTNLSGHISGNHFSTFTGLKILNIADSNLTSFDVSVLRHLPVLSALILSKNSLSTFSDPYDWCTGTACTSLQINLLNMRQWQCDDRICWAKYFPSPMKISLSGCSGISFAAITFQQFGCPEPIVMKATSRNGMSLSIASSSVLGSSKNRFRTNLPTLRYCQFWCTEKLTCTHLYFFPKSLNDPHGEGDCEIFA